MLVHPSAINSLYIFDIAQVIGAYALQLFRGNFVIEMDQSIAIASHAAQHICFFCGEYAMLFESCRDLFVVADADGEAFSQNVSPNVEQRLQAAAQTGIGCPKISTVTENAALSASGNA